jgi:hypothetical protein
MPTYRVTGGPDGTAGLNYKDKRAEPGDEVSDIPRESIKWLREQGYIDTPGEVVDPEPIPAPSAEDTPTPVADPEEIA